MKTQRTLSSVFPASVPASCAGTAAQGDRMADHFGHAGRIRWARLDGDLKGTGARVIAEENPEGSLGVASSMAALAASVERV